MKIEVKNVSKHFKKGTNILEDVNLELDSGKIYGFIGKNGTGKTVLLKLICGYYKPSNGDITYDFKSIVNELEYPPSTRTLIENPSFIPNLTGYQNLKLLADIQKKVGKKEIEEALKKVNLYEEKDKFYYKYSLGMKQKLGIAQVLMENPDVMIFDEPFNAIEEKTVQDLRLILKEYAKEGKIIVIATHIKEDIEQLVDVIYKFDDKRVIKL